MQKASHAASPDGRPGRLYGLSQKGVMNPKQFGCRPVPLPPPKHFTGGASYLQLFKPSVPSCVQRFPPSHVSASVYPHEGRLQSQRGRPTPRGARLKVGSSESPWKPDLYINAPAGSPPSERPRCRRRISPGDSAENIFHGLPLISSPRGLPKPNIQETPRRVGNPEGSSSSGSPLARNGNNRKLKQQSVSARDNAIEQSRFDEHAGALQANFARDPMWASIASHLGPRSEKHTAAEVPTLEGRSSIASAHPSSTIVVPKIQARTNQSKARGRSQDSREHLQIEHPRPRGVSHSKRLDAIQGSPREVKPSSITRRDVTTEGPISPETSPRTSKPLYLAALEVGCQLDAAKRHLCPPLTSRSTSKAGSSPTPPEPSSASHPPVLTPLTLAPQKVITFPLGPSGDEIQHAGKATADLHKSSKAIKKRSKSVERSRPAALSSGDDMLVVSGVSPNEDLIQGSGPLSERTGNQRGNKHLKSVSASPKTRKPHKLKFLSPPRIRQPDDSSGHGG